MSKLVKVAQADRLPPGTRKLCDAEGRRIALFNLDGTLYAIDNHCTHRDGPVGAGELHDAVITCPWHGWRFDVATGRCLEGGADLRCYPVHVEGNDVLIQVVATDGSDREDGIYCCLVRYGALGHVSRVGTVTPVPCRRGDRVVVNTDRGIELAEVLEAQRSARVARVKDGRRVNCCAWRRTRTNDTSPNWRIRHQRVLEDCQDLLTRRGLPVTAVDAEQLLDGQTIVVYYLGEPTEQLGPVAVELSKTADNRRVQFQPMEGLQATNPEDSVQPSAKRPKRSKQELIKESSEFLRGGIIEELAGGSDEFTSHNASLLKFHGTYQQDDRDTRKSHNPADGKAGKKHIFMVRTKIPGGKLTAGQLLSKLDLCDRFADGTLRLTTRQGLQLHGVVKGNLWQTIHEINQSLLSTLGACGDVVRNVMCLSCTPSQRSGSRLDAGHGGRHRQALRATYFDLL